MQSTVSQRELIQYCIIVSNGTCQASDIAALVTLTQVTICVLLFIYYLSHCTC